MLYYKVEATETEGVLDVYDKNTNEILHLTVRSEKCEAVFIALSDDVFPQVERVDTGDADELYIRINNGKQMFYVEIRPIEFHGAVKVTPSTKRDEYEYVYVS